jgi:RNA polymerase sigma-70 factor (ECF subfamily)
MSPEDQDAADIARFVAGDGSAFEAIVVRWQQRLVTLAWRFCRDRAMAEDMTQEVFVKLFRSAASFRGDAKASTWLIAIAVNTFRSRLRDEGQPLASLEPRHLETVARGAGAHGTMEERERAEAVRRAVLTLPEIYRDAILVYYFEEKDLAESAGVLGVSGGTLKARLHRARELLKRRCASLGGREAGENA